jgi:nicotinamidase-related amidase
MSEANSAREAIIVLDMTRDSIAPEARAVENRKAILPRVREFLAWGRKSGRQVVFVCSARRKTDKWFLKYWELVNEIGKPGLEPIPELYDAQKDVVVHKRRYSGFFDSDLDLTLRELGVTSLIMFGWSTSLAVATTAIDAWQLGYPTTVVSDLCISHAWGGHTVEETHKWSLEFIEAMAKSRIATTTDLMK